MMLCTSCKIALSNTFCGATTVFEYRRNDRFCMQNARREKIRVLYCFLTGADVLAVKKLKVIFHFQVGNIPHITAHTYQLLFTSWGVRKLP